MLKRNWHIALLLFWISICGLQAQVAFDQFNLVNNDKITKRAITNIIQDQSGFIWIGTNGVGLYKYDGSNHIAYNHDWDDTATINSNYIYGTYLDDENRLWVGTDAGLNLYNRDLDKFERIDLKIESAVSLGNVPVKCIGQDRYGNLLVGTYDRGLFKIDAENFKLTKIDLGELNESDLLIKSIKKNKLGEVYIGTSKGLFNFNWNEQLLQAVLPNPLTVESILFDEDNNLWAGTRSSGVLKVVKKDASYKIHEYPVTKKKIFSLLHVDNSIVLGTENDGLIVLDKEGEVTHKFKQSKFDKNSLRSNSIWSLFEDADNRIWIGYYNNGLSIYDRLFSKFKSIECIASDPNSLQASSITGLAKDASGKLWISMAGGIDIYDPVTKKIEHINSNNTSKYKGLNKDAMQTVFIDSNENVWLGTWNNGIYLLPKGAKSFINFNVENTNGQLATNGILNFDEDSKGRIWIASYLKGLHYYDPAKKRFFYCDSQPFADFNLLNADVKDVLVDSQDHVWMGTTSGLYKVTYINPSDFIVESMKEKMPEGRKQHSSIHNVLSLYETKQQQLWVGTNGGGLLFYDNKKNTFESYNKHKDFDEISINGIIEGDDDSIWVSGDSGMTNIDLINNETTNYTIDDGLLSNYFNKGSILKDKNGTLYVGGYSGINYFNPKEITTNASAPSLIFTNFKLFNKEVKPSEKNSPLTKVISQTKQITLNHDQSVFTIEYVGVGFTRPEKNAYAYYIEGVDPDWNYVGNTNNATYTNIGRGTYTFKVKSANNDGVWNETPLELKITVLPPWWKTNQAYALYLLLLISSLYGASLIVRKRIRAKQAVEFERNKRLQEEKLNNKKLQFFTNISHEFRTPLTLIINPLKDIIKTPNLDLPEEVKEKHNVIYKNSDRLSRLINELMDFRKLESNKIKLQVQEIDVVEQVKDILSYFSQEAKHRGISFIFSSERSKLIAWTDVSVLEKVLFNIISNAFKVTPDKGAISIMVKLKQIELPLVSTEVISNAYEISVLDTGPGLNKKEQKKIFKRFYQANKLNKSYYGSTGIGLEVVKDFVSLHKGNIGIESKVGEGTKFILSFPQDKNYFTKKEILKSDINLDTLLKIDTLDITTTNSQKIDGFASGKKEYTILIVEDNAELRNYLKGELQAYYSILIAENGQKGFDLAIEKSPDIIITDVVMPIMDGLKLCEKIKGDIKTSHIPLLMLTARALVEDKIKGIDSGADIYMNKPFNMSVLKSQLAQLLSSRKVLFDKYYQGVSEEAADKTPTVDNEFIRKVLAYMHENLSEPDLSVEVLAAEFFLSRSQLYRKIKALTGQSANEFIRKIRLEKAKELLETTNYNVNEITYQIGFSSPSYFTKCFKAAYNCLPTEHPNLPPKQ